MQSLLRPSKVIFENMIKEDCDVIATLAFYLITLKDYRSIKKGYADKTYIKDSKTKLDSMLYVSALRRACIHCLRGGRSNKAACLYGVEIDHIRLLITALSNAERTRAHTLTANFDIMPLTNKKLKQIWKIFDRVHRYASWKVHKRLRFVAKVNGYELNDLTFEILNILLQRIPTLDHLSLNQIQNNLVKGVNDTAENIRIFHLRRKRSRYALKHTVLTNEGYNILEKDENNQAVVNTFNIGEDLDFTCADTVTPHDSIIKHSFENVLTKLPAQMREVAEAMVDWEQQEKYRKNTTTQRLFKLRQEYGVTPGQLEYIGEITSIISKGYEVDANRRLKKFWDYVSSNNSKPCDLCSVCFGCGKPLEVGELICTNCNSPKPLVEGCPICGAANNGGNLCVNCLAVLEKVIYENSRRAASVEI